MTIVWFLLDGGAWRFCWGSPSPASAAAGRIARRHQILQRSLAKSYQSMWALQEGMPVSSYVVTLSRCDTEARATIPCSRRSSPTRRSNLPTRRQESPSRRVGATTRAARSSPRTRESNVPLRSRLGALPATGPEMGFKIDLGLIIPARILESAPLTLVDPARRRESCR